MSTLRTSSIMEVPLAGLARAGIADGSPEPFTYPNGLAADRGGNIIVADNVNHRIRIIAPSGIMRTLAGSGRAGFADGAGPSAQFRYVQSTSRCKVLQGWLRKGASCEANLREPEKPTETHLAKTTLEKGS